VVTRSGRSCFAGERILSKLLSGTSQSTSLRPLGLTHQIFSRRFLRYINYIPKEFLEQNKESLGIERITKNAKFWSDSEMIAFAIHVKSEKAINFRIELIEFIRQNAQCTPITQEQYHELTEKYEDLQEKFYNLENLVTQSVPAAQSTASFLGKALRSQRNTKKLRELTH
jgi:hypothetical protein